MPARHMAMGTRESWKKLTARAVCIQASEVGPCGDSQERVLRGLMVFRIVRRDKDRAPWVSKLPLGAGVKRGCKML
jgi:hypothetical protein